MADGGPSDEKHSIRMVADRLLVVPSKEAGERKSRAGILIPATADVSRRLVWAEVAAVGPDGAHGRARRHGALLARDRLRGRDPGRRVPDPARARRARGRVAAQRGRHGALPVIDPGDRAAARRQGRARHRRRPAASAAPSPRRARRRAPSVVVVARKPAELEETAAAIAALGARVVTVQGSVGDPEVAEHAVAPSDRRARPAATSSSTTPRSTPCSGRSWTPTSARSPRCSTPTSSGRCASCARRGTRYMQEHGGVGAERRVGRRHARRAVHRRVQRVEGRAHPPHPPARAGARADGARERDRARRS